MEFEYEPRRASRWKGCLVAAMILPLGAWMALEWESFWRWCFPARKSTIPTITEGVTLKPLPPPPPAAESLFREGLDAEARQAWEEAATKFRAAGEGGMPRGSHHLGLLQMDGRLGKKDYEGAALSFATAFRNSNGILLESLWKLAWLYEQGAGVPRDEDLSKQMRDHVLSAAPLDIAEPETRDFVSSLWEEGKAGRRDLMKAFTLQEHGGRTEEKALLLLNKACQEKNPEALHRMGLAFSRGEFGLAKDDEKAFEWFEKAAEQKHPAALFALAECWAIGRGVEKDDEKAVQALRAAIDVKEPSKEALVAWGGRLLEGRGVAQDRKEAFATFQRAAASDRLALCLEKGWGTPKDPLEAGRLYSHMGSLDKAKPLLLKAVQEGHPEALVILGRAYMASRRRRSAEAVLLEAVKLGVVDSDLVLGVLYLRADDPDDLDEGESRVPRSEALERDPKKAEPLLRKAADRGNPEAAVLLTRFGFEEAKSGSAPAGGPGLGISAQLRRAAESGHLPALVECAKLAVLRAPVAPRDDIAPWPDSLAKALQKPGQTLAPEDAQRVFGQWGEVLLNAGGTQGDPVRARRAFQTGARFDSSTCWLGLANLYRQGLGVEKDPIRALYCEGRGLYLGMREGEGC